jgi:hypothetical protein
MKNISLLILVSLITMSHAFSDTTATFKCTLDPNQFSQDFKLNTVSFSVKQAGNSVSFVKGSLVSDPVIADFKNIDLNTEVASDLNEDPATSIDGGLIILGRDNSTNRTVMLSLNQPEADHTYKAEIDVYTGGSDPADQEPEQEAHLICNQ